MDQLDTFETLNAMPIKVTASKDGRILIEAQPALTDNEPRQISLYIANGVLMIETIYGTIAFPTVMR